MYKLINDVTGQVSLTLIQRITDGAFIPVSEDNSDYQTYLVWLSEVNTPTPADVPV